MRATIALMDTYGQAGYCCSLQSIAMCDWGSPFWQHSWLLLSLWTICRRDEAFSWPPGRFLHVVVCFTSIDVLCVYIKASTFVFFGRSPVCVSGSVTASICMPCAFPAVSLWLDVWSDSYFFNLILLWFLKCWFVFWHRKDVNVNGEQLGGVAGRL